MMVPLILAGLINTLLPSLLHFGVFTEALFTSAGMKTLMGINLIAAGSQIHFSNIFEIFKRFSVIAIARLGAGLLIIFLVASFLAEMEYLVYPYLPWFALVLTIIILFLSP